MSKAEVVQMAVDAVKLIKAQAEAMPETEISLEYSPELFTATELDFAKEVCDAVTDAWGPPPAQSHSQSPNHSRNRHAQYIRGPNRVDAPEPCSPRQRHHQPPPAQ
jgi:isopropylmalate/homocitrate/citramalate synthase